MSYKLLKEMYSNKYIIREITDYIPLQIKIYLLEDERPLYISYKQYYEEVYIDCITYFDNFDIRNFYKEEWDSDEENVYPKIYKI